MATARNVVLVAFEGAQLLDLAGPIDVMDAAARALAGQGGALAAGKGPTPDDHLPGGYTVRVATLRGVPVRTSSGPLIVPDVALESVDAGEVDTVIVTGTPFVEHTLSNAQLVGEIARLASSARRTASVFTGAFLLAAAGILDGKRATTHWANCIELARRFPNVTVEPDAIFIRDGSAFTSAGVTAGIDMSLAMIEDDLGADIALGAARRLVTFLRRPGGQSQYSELLSSPTNIASPLQKLVDDIVTDPAGDHRVSTLARRMELSERHTSRLFLAQTGVSASRFVERVRVETARRLLERSDATVAQVAERCGLGSPETLRRAFTRVLRVSPSDYRKRFENPPACPETFKFEAPVVPESGGERNGLRQSGRCRDMRC